MRSVNTPVTVEWEDCDPFGIVFYPNFFNYFDRGTWNIYYAKGLTRDIMRDEHGGTFPAADAQATFFYPCRFKDELVLVSTLAEIQKKNIIITHVIHSGDQIAVTGREVRFWGIPHPTNPKRIKAAPIPQAVIEVLQG